MYTQAKYIRLYLLLEFESKSDPRICTVSFDFNALNDEQCLERFRFTKEDLIKLSIGLLGENTLRTCVSLSIAWHLGPRGILFRSSMGDQSLPCPIYFCTLKPKLINNRRKCSFSIMNTLQTTWRTLLTTYLQKVDEIDYNFSQQSVYCGHKRKHALKFQAILTIDGLVSHLYGPAPGRDHDLRLYREAMNASSTFVYTVIQRTVRIPFVVVLSGELLKISLKHRELLTVA